MVGFTRTSAGFFLPNHLPPNQLNTGMNVIALSQNFYLNEFTRSATAARLGIDNLPNQEHLDNLIALCENVLQPLRDHLNAPVKVTSGYRCPTLNTSIGGAKNSQHMTGQAADLVIPNHSNTEVADYIREHLTFDQLIYEFPDPETNEIEWVHVSYSIHHNRNESLVAYKDTEGKTVYQSLDEYSNLPY